jgi:hypothetical protein
VSLERDIGSGFFFLSFGYIAFTTPGIFSCNDISFHFNSIPPTPVKPQASSLKVTNVEHDLRP